MTKKAKRTKRTPKKTGKVKKVSGNPVIYHQGDFMSEPGDDDDEERPRGIRPAWLEMRRKCED